MKRPTVTLLVPMEQGIDLGLVSHALLSDRESPLLLLEGGEALAHCLSDRLIEDILIEGFPFEDSLHSNLLLAQELHAHIILVGGPQSPCQEVAASYLRVSGVTLLGVIGYGGTPPSEYEELGEVALIHSLPALRDGEILARLQPTLLSSQPGHFNSVIYLNSNGIEGLLDIEEEGLLAIVEGAQRTLLMALFSHYQMHGHPHGLLIAGCDPEDLEWVTEWPEGLSCMTTRETGVSVLYRFIPPPCLHLPKEEPESSEWISPPFFHAALAKKAASRPQRILLPEGHDSRVIEAASRAAEAGYAYPVVFGDSLIVSPGVEVINPSPIQDRYVEALVEKRQHKGMTRERAQKALMHPITLSMMMLAMGEVDGVVAGATCPTADVLRPAFQLVGLSTPGRKASSFFFLCLPDQVILFGDCAINPDPSSEELMESAIQGAQLAEHFGIAPRIAMISYSTGGSGSGPSVDKVGEATEGVQKKASHLPIEGPIQYDAALVPEVARIKAPNSVVAGHATVLIFPDLNTANTAYKAVQRSGNVMAVGPVIQGMKRPVNDLSRGATVDDIFSTIMLTAAQSVTSRFLHEKEEGIPS
ncbi:MAG: phosphate acetyltransferase [Chlamydiota bacterium]|nr:phosphate acetyltransferase [Chlamydiota bacterium]